MLKIQKKNEGKDEKEVNTRRGNAVGKRKERGREEENNSKRKIENGEEMLEGKEGTGEGETETDREQKENEEERERKRGTKQQQKKNRKG